MYAPLHDRDLRQIARTGANTIICPGLGTHDSHMHFFALAAKYNLWVIPSLPMAKYQVRYSAYSGATLRDRFQLAQHPVVLAQLTEVKLDWRLVTQDIVSDWTKMVERASNSTTTVAYAVDDLFEIFIPTQDADRQRVAHFFGGILPSLKTAVTTVSGASALPIIVPIFANYDGMIVRFPLSGASILCMRV